MSLYDEASLIFTPAGAGGNRNTAHSIKPVEKLKSEEVSDNGFNDSSEWTVAFGATVGNGSAVFNSSNANSNTDFQRVSQSNVFTDGREYVVSASVVIREGKIKFQVNGANEAIGVADTTGKYSFYYTAGDGHTFSNVLEFGRKDSGVDWDFEVLSISVKEVEQKAIDFKIDRGSDESATLVGADGLIKRHTHNLLKGTEDFNNSTYWSIPGDFYVDGVNQGPSYTSPLPEGEVVGYNGSKEGVFTLDKTSGHNNYFMADGSDNAVTTSSTDVWTYSVYAKADGDSTLLIGIWNNGSPQIGHGHRLFALNGVSGGMSGTSNHDPNPLNHPRAYIEKVGDDGWYRCSVTNVSQIQGMRVRLQPRAATGAQNSGGKVYVMHPQFEKGTGATQYVRSYAETCKGGVLEDEPRFDYSGGGCPGLLLEREVTNELKSTEWFPAWGNNGEGTSTVTPNFAISPDGSNNATKYTANNGYRHLRLTVSSLDTDSKYVFSFYAKNIDATSLRANVYDLTNQQFLISGDYNYLPEVSTTAWNRIEIVFTTASDSTSYAVYISQGKQVLSDGDPGGSVLFWGAQLEKQNHTGGDYGYASSYIPNYAGTGNVTRKKDDVPDDRYRFGRDNIFDGNQATIFIESNNLRKIGNTRWWHIFDEDKKEDPRILLYSANGTDLGAGERGYNIRLQLRADHDHTRETILTGPNLSYGDTFKAIARLNNNVVTLFVNGTQYDTGATESVSYDYAQWETETVRPYERFELAHETGDLGYKIFNLMIFPTILTDDECKNLTSLS